MNIQRLLNTPSGQIIISILLGLGLATMFYKVCSDKNCIVFNGPVITDIDTKIYKHDGKCYSYNVNSAKCDETKKIIDVSTPPVHKPFLSSILPTHA